GIDRTLKEIGQTVKTVSGVALPFDSMLDDNEDIRDILDYIGDTLQAGVLEEATQEREEAPRRSSASDHEEASPRSMRERRRW
ncbi:MAG: hypothetical protein RMJ54_17100, partial [Roseiflexaceae bacterium]|nr:hypothetical protein [Roseiflexaceae bacterium]